MGWSEEIALIYSKMYQIDILLFLLELRSSFLLFLQSVVFKIRHFIREHQLIVKPYLSHLMLRFCSKILINVKLGKPKL